MSEQRKEVFSVTSLEMGMSRGVSPTTRSDVKSFRLVVVMFAWPTCSFAVEDLRSGKFLCCVYGLRPVGAFGTLCVPSAAHIVLG